MIIYPGKTFLEEGRLRLEVDVELESSVFPKTGTNRMALWADWPEDCAPAPDNPGEFALAICLPIAMCVGERVRLHDPISETFLLNVLEAVAVYKHYWSDLCEVVEIEAATARFSQSEAAGVGSFYSGGVDSLYNVAEMRRLSRLHGSREITDFWLIQGMDIPLDEAELWEETVTRAQQQLGGTGGKLVTIRTNARDLHQRLVGWELMGFGPILGGLSKLFAGQISAALIGSYGTYDQVIPHASSPLVDPLWSCDRQSVRHFSSRASRQDKISIIGEHAPELLKHLRVCYENRDGAYNCGVCEKCMRTQLQLRLAGHLHLAESFPRPLQPSDMRGLWLPMAAKNKYAWDFWEGILAELEAQGDGDLATPLRRRMFRLRIRRVIWRLRNRFS